MRFQASLVPRMFAAGLTMAMISCSGVSAPNASGPAPMTGGEGFTTAASTQLWLQQFGTGTVLAAPPQLSPTTGLFHGGDVLTGIAVDAAGDTIVSGYTRGAFPGYSNPAHVPQDLVAKFDSTGKQLWLRQFGTGASDYLNTVAVDKSGNILVGGFTTGTFPGFSNPNAAPQAVIVKLDAAGNQLWLRQFTSASGIAVRAIATSEDGSVLLTGVLNQQITQPQPGQLQLLAQSALVVKLSGATGQTIWQQRVAPIRISILNSIAVDSAGNAIAVGEAIQSPTAPATSDTFQFLAVKLAAGDGHQVWQQTTIGPSNPATQGLLTGTDVDADGDAIVVGSQFGGGSAACLMAKLDSATGQPVWITPFGSATLTDSGTVSVSPAGDIFTAGNTLAALLAKFQPNLQDVYVAKFNNAGQSLWVQQFGMLEETLISGDVNFIVGPLPQGNWPQVATDASGNVLVGGTTRGQFPGFSNPSQAYEPFLAKFGP